MATEEATKDSAPAAADKKEDDSVVDAVAERLRFFFGNANVRQDIFLRKLLLKDDGAVPIEVLLRFNTIKQHTEDPEVVKKAVATDRVKEHLVLAEDASAIKRVKPFTLDMMSENIPLTLIVENLPTKEEENGKIFYAVKPDEIRAMFESYGDVAIVKLRFGPRVSDEEADDGADLETPSENKPKKRGPRIPRGSALVEFETEKACQAAAEDTLTKTEGGTVTPKRKLELGGNELGVITLKEFIDQLRSRKSDDGEKKSADETDKEKEKDNEEKEEEEADPAPVFKMDWKPGCVLKLDGLKESCDREALLDSVCECLDTTLQDVKGMMIYVDFSRGQSHGAIRFKEPDESVKKVLEKLKDGTVKIADEKVESVILLEGDDEKKYWDDFIAFKTKQLKHRHEERSGKRKHNNNRRNQGRKKRRS